MNEVLIDSNIFINVWSRETDPKTGRAFWETSGRLFESIRKKDTVGCLSITSLLEIAHRIRVCAGERGRDPRIDVQKALSDIQSIGLRQVSPDSVSLARSLSFLVDCGLDPFDAILVATAADEEMDAIISRDEKLIRKASKIIPVLTPEEFLSLKR